MTALTASEQWFLALVALVALQRLSEVVLSARNARRLMTRGGVEFGRSHLPAMIALHVAFLVAAPLEVVLLHRTFVPWLGWPLVGVLLATQALRYWAIRTLGDRWSVRVISVPSEPVVVAGPYRFLRHPNYLAVIVEIAALPLVHSAWLTALVFSGLNAWMLRVRIRCEEQALVSAADYAHALGDRARFLPRAS